MVLNAVDFINVSCVLILSSLPTKFFVISLTHKTTLGIF